MRVLSRTIRKLWKSLKEPIAEGNTIHGVITPKKFLFKDMRVSMKTEGEANTVYEILEIGEPVPQEGAEGVGYIRLRPIPAPEPPEDADEHFGSFWISEDFVRLREDSIKSVGLDKLILWRQIAVAKIDATLLKGQNKELESLEPKDLVQHSAVLWAKDGARNFVQDNYYPFIRKMALFWIKPGHEMGLTGFFNENSESNSSGAGEYKEFGPKGLDFVKIIERAVDCWAKEFAAEPFRVVDYYTERTGLFDWKSNDISIYHSLIFESAGFRPWCICILVAILQWLAPVLVVLLQFDTDGMFELCRFRNTNQNISEEEEVGSFDNLIFLAGIMCVVVLLVGFIPKAFDVVRIDSGLGETNSALILRMTHYARYSALKRGHYSPVNEAGLLFYSVMNGYYLFCLYSLAILAIIFSQDVSDLIVRIGSFAVIENVDELVFSSSWWPAGWKAKFRLSVVRLHLVSHLDKKVWGSGTSEANPGRKFWLKMDGIYEETKLGKLTGKNFSAGIESLFESLKDAKDEDVGYVRDSFYENRGKKSLCRKIASGLDLGCKALTAVAVVGAMAFTLVISACLEYTD